MFCLPHREKFFIATIIIQSLCIALSFTVLAYTTVLRLRYLGLLHEAARTLTYIFLFLAFCLLGIFTLPFLFLLQEITSEGGTSTIPSFGYDIMYAWFGLAIACLMRLYVLATRAMLREVRVIEKGLLYGAFEKEASKEICEILWWARTTAYLTAASGTTSILSLVMHAIKSALWTSYPWFGHVVGLFTLIDVLTSIFCLLLQGGFVGPLLDTEKQLTGAKGVVGELIELAEAEKETALRAYEKIASRYLPGRSEVEERFAKLDRLESLIRAASSDAEKVQHFTEFRLQCVQYQEDNLQLMRECLAAASLLAHRWQVLSTVDNYVFSNSEFERIFSNFSFL